METLKTIWDFFQNEVLGMNWLNRLIETILNACGLDTTGKIGGSVQFFIYDTVKIMVLLGVLILIISYIQSYFPPERAKKILGRFHGIWANIIAALYGNTVLLVFFHSVVYRVYKRRFAAWRYILLFDFFADG